jgi:plasmid stability protein
VGRITATQHVVAAQMTPAMAEALRVRAAAEERSMSAEIRVAIRAHLATTTNEAPLPGRSVDNSGHGRPAHAA